MGGISSVRILLVDDSRQMRFLVRSVLQAVGFRRIAESGDGPEALEAIRDEGADLIITDYAMQPINGIEFARMVRQAPDSLARFAPIIMMTGLCDRSRVQSARDGGVNAVLAKPVSAKSICHHVSAVIADRRPFVRTKTFFGPDRRVAHNERYKGPRRRASDGVGAALDLDALD